MVFLQDFVASSPLHLLLYMDYTCQPRPFRWVQPNKDRIPKEVAWDIPWPWSLLISAPPRRQTDLNLPPPDSRYTSLLFSPDAFWCIHMHCVVLSYLYKCSVYLFSLNNNKQNYFHLFLCFWCHQPLWNTHKEISEILRLSETPITPWTVLRPRPRSPIQTVGCLWRNPWIPWF